MQKVFTYHEGGIIPEITTPPLINKRQSLVSVVQEEKLPWLEEMCTIEQSTTQLVNLVEQI